MDEEKLERLRLARLEELSLGVPLYCYAAKGSMLFDVKVANYGSLTLINQVSRNTVGHYEYMSYDGKYVFLSRHPLYRIYLDPLEIVQDLDEDDEDCI